MPSKKLIKSILVEEPRDSNSKIPSLLKLGLESDIQSFCPKECQQILKMSLIQCDLQQSLREQINAFKIIRIVFSIVTKLCLCAINDMTKLKLILVSSYRITVKILS